MTYNAIYSTITFLYYINDLNTYIKTSKAFQTQTIYCTMYIYGFSEQVSYTPSQSTIEINWHILQTKPNIFCSGILQYSIYLSNWTKMYIYGFFGQLLYTTYQRAIEKVIYTTCHIHHLCTFLASLSDLMCLHSNFNSNIFY